jgi:O-antigen/teichoic acid export membrane protein
MESATTNATGATGSRLARRLFSNYVFQSMNLGIRLFEQLLLTPLYLYAWGTDLYKDWLIIWALVTFFMWCNFGIEDYFGNVFLRLAAIGDHHALRRQIRIGLFVSYAITLIVMVALYGTILLVPIHNLLGIEALDRHRTLFCLIAMTLPICLWYPVETLRATYRAFGELSRGECVFAIYNTVQIVTACAALALRQSPEVLALCYGVVPIIYYIFTVIDVSRRYPVISLGFTVPTRAEWWMAVRQSLMYFTMPLAILMTQNVTLLVFGVLGVAAAVTVQYSVLRVFTGLARQIGCQSFVVGSGVEMARLRAQGDHEACRKLYDETGRIAACLAGLLCGVSLPSADSFVRLWTHGVVSSDMLMIAWFLAGIFLSAPGRASLMLLRYANYAGPIAIANICQAMGGLLLVILLVPRFGGTGAAASFAVTEALAIGLYPALVVRSQFGFSALRHLAVSLSVGAVVFVASYAVAAAVFDGGAHGLVSLFAKGALWGVAILPFGYFLILSRAQRVFVVGAIRRRLRCWRAAPTS